MTHLNLPRQPWNACAKIKHTTQESAEQHRQKLNRNDKLNNPLATAIITYWCDQCQAWHVGHNSRPAAPPANAPKFTREQLVTAWTPPKIQGGRRKPPRLRLADLPRRCVVRNGSPSPAVKLPPSGPAEAPAPPLAAPQAEQTPQNPTVPHKPTLAELIRKRQQL